MQTFSKGYKIYKMKTCNVTVVSNNPNSIQKFFLFFFYNKKMSFNTIKKYFQKKRKKKILTILKSPHVNKTAQEQFEYRIYSKQITMYSSQGFQYLVFLKKVSVHLFPDIKIKIKFDMSQSMGKQTEILNPTHLKRDFFRSENWKNSKLKTKNMIETFDIYGELLGMDSDKFG
jgi:ribosomal protein S10